MWWLAMVGCDPYRSWPEPEEAFPYVFTPEADLEPYEEVRWETETWDPTNDLTMAGSYLLKATYHRPGAPEEVLAHFEAMRAAIPPLGDGLRISFAGDVMWVGGNWSAFLAPSAHLLDGDLRVGNLETPVAASFPTDPGELDLYAFNAPEEMLDGLPFDALQLNNNHSLDVGDPGLEETVAAVTARGYAATGVDAHAVVDVAGSRVALLSYTWGLNVRGVDSTHELFVIPFGHIGEEIDLSPLADDVAAARLEADVVVVLVHWGFEYEYNADPHFLVLGREIVAAGADLVVGQGPHVAQPPELCAVNDPEVVPGIGTCSLRTDDGEPRTAAILYSLGNFGTGMPTVPCQVGIVATASFAGRSVTGLGWAPAVTVEGPSVVPLDDRMDDQELAAESARLDAHLGAGWRR